MKLANEIHTIDIKQTHKKHTLTSTLKPIPTQETCTKDTMIIHKNHTYKKQNVYTNAQTHTSDNHTRFAHETYQTELHDHKIHNKNF